MLNVEFNSTYSKRTTMSILKMLEMFGIGAAGSLMSGGIDSLFGSVSSNRQQSNQKELANLQYEHNSALMDKAYENQLEFWKEQNDYNTPAAQKARLQAAGYSPNFVDGVLNTAGGLSATPTSSVGQGSAAATGQTKTDVAAAAQQAANVSLTDAQRDNIQADTRLKEQQANTEVARLGLIENESALLEVQAVGQDISNQLDNINLYIAGNTADARIQIVRADLDKVVADTFVALSQADLNDALSREALENLAYISAGVALREMQYELTDAQRAFVMEEVAGRVLQNEFLIRQLRTDLPELQSAQVAADVAYTERRRTNETVSTWNNVVNETISTVLNAAGSFMTGGLSKLARSSMQGKIDLDRAKTNATTYRGMLDKKRATRGRLTRREYFDRDGNSRGGFAQQDN